MHPERYELTITPDEVQVTCRSCGQLVWDTKTPRPFRSLWLSEVTDAVADHEAEVRHPIDEGTRVEIHDPGTNSHSMATVVAFTKRGDQIGYAVRYENGCEVWVRDWRVRELRSA